MNNPSIAGWRVKNRIICADHVSQTADDYRSVTIPIDVIGTLTGDISVYLKNIDEQEWHIFAMDAQRIKHALIKNILPGSAPSGRKGIKLLATNTTSHRRGSPCVTYCAHG